MQRTQTKKIERTQIRDTRTKAPVAGQLRIKSRRDGHVFLDRDKAGTRQLRTSLRHVVVQLLLIGGKDGHVEMVLAQDKVARGQLIHRKIQLHDLTDRLVLG
ncbi:hypothetical protein D9M68_898780 [compost metagenome]